MTYLRRGDQIYFSSNEMGKAGWQGQCVLLPLLQIFEPYKHGRIKGYKMPFFVSFVNLRVFVIQTVG